MSQDALAHFFQRYHASWQQSLGQDPVSEQTEQGPALTGRDDQGRALWQAHHRTKPGQFDNVAEALELTLHPALTEFYGHYFAGHLAFDAPFGRGELLQPWNQADFEYLQENLIGHLLMKRKLKQPPTLFIGVVGEGMLVLDNADGSVWLEVPGQEPHQRVADSVAALLSELTPCAELPKAAPEPDQAPSTGFWARVKTMVSHLMPKSRR
ncbi:SecY-interacting protein [Ferrimonas balearica]|uniref:SecY-interacting protein n=1 Tax=Ferrimonas balearica TaxID=44012 RepID=UPI001C995E0B|nr:SecY-interacting protein [Ferrimonas balearica]MBY5990636.1 SecY-interacting protein [Ferrimonas balearica]